MSKMSDERLIVAVVKNNDCEAMKLLEDRVQSEIRSFLESTAHRSGVEIEDIESQILPQGLQAEILQDILTQLHKYRFVVSFQEWVHRMVRGASIRYNNQQSFGRKPRSERSLPEASSTVNRPSIQAKLPPLEEIDLEIRSLVSLLNESSHIQTTCSCSGHPNREEWKTREWNPFGGWIHIEPTDDPRAALDFLTTLLARLDNTHSVETTPGIRREDDTSIDTPRQLYQQADAGELFHSGAPIVVIGVYLSLFVYHHEATQRLQVWRSLIASIKDLITNDKEFCPEIDTPKIAIQRLKETLHRLPFIYSVELVTDNEGYPGLRLFTKADRALCQWFSELAARIHLASDTKTYLDADTKRHAQFVAKWGFSLQPRLNAELIPLQHLIKHHWEPRTREDHLKIWKLIELAVAEQLPQ